MDLLKRDFQEKLFKIFPIVIGFITIVLYIIGSFVIKIERPMLIELDKPAVLDSNWYYSDTKEVIQENSIPIYTDKTISVSHKIPQAEHNKNYLVLWNFYSQYEVRLDGELLDVNGSEDKVLFGKEVGGLYFFIPIPDGNHEEITLSLKSTWGTRKFSLKAVFFGTKNQIGLQILKKNTICILICIILSLYVVLLLLYLGVMNSYKLFDYSRLIIALCGLTAVSIFYILNESNIYQFLILNPSVRYLGSYFAVYFTPVFGCIFFREYFKRGKKFYLYLQNIYSLILIAALFLYAFNIMHVLTSVVIVYIGVFLIGYAVFRYGIQDYKETKDHLYINAIIAVFILIFGTTVSVVLYYLGLTTDNIIPFSYTYVAFISILFVSVMRKTFREFSLVSSAGYYRELAYTDKVTGGHSTLFFEEKLQTNNYVNSTFVLINLVHFKLINQIIGRKKSDDTIKSIYETIENIIKPGELLCSLGNARFAVMIDTASNKENDITSFCSNIQKAVADYQKTKNQTVKVNLQFSICENTKDINTLEDLVDYASMAVYSENAKFIPDINCYIYNEECNNKLIKEKMYSDYMETALANNEFKVYMQPKVSLKDGKVHSAEALVRWINPEKGIIPPDEFIPTFEKDGKIEKLDLYNFRKVCLFINEWLQKGKEPPVISINISKAAITYEGYFKSYMKIIKELKVPGKYIEFELTESIAYNNIEMLREIIKQIHDIGSTCSMDDFGKSYSNIGVLGVLPFDTAKMDKCFFDSGFPNESKQVQLVKGTVELLKNLNLEIIAEGIEEKKQVEELEKIGCDAIQGYFFAKPMDIESFTEFVKYTNKE